MEMNPWSSQSGLTGQLWSDSGHWLRAQPLHSGFGNTGTRKDGCVTPGGRWASHCQPYTLAYRAAAACSEGTPSPSGAETMAALSPVGEIWAGGPESSCVLPHVRESSEDWMGPLVSGLLLWGHLARPRPVFSSPLGQDDQARGLSPLPWNPRLLTRSLAWREHSCVLARVSLLLASFLKFVCLFVCFSS